MSVKFTRCDKPNCQCYHLHKQLEDAKDPSKWEFGVEFFSTEFIQDALDMQLELCKKIKNPFYC
jgi:hypothetical protein